jgi:hypothetical protein
MVTVNPALFENNGERAWDEITYKRGIGNLIKNLSRTEGIEIVDWIAFVEWHEGGFAHWHLLIEVTDEGKAGMIGRVRVKRYWPWGIWIREEGIRDEHHWIRMLGYFDTHGYFEGDKGHQGSLPAWAKDGNRRIKRWESMKGKKQSVRMRQEERLSEGQYLDVEPEESEKRCRRSYGLILKHCGAKTRLVMETNSWTHSSIVDIPYLEIKAGWAWEYLEGKGLVLLLSEDQYREFIAKVITMEAERSPQGGNVPVPDLVQESITLREG